MTTTVKKILWASAGLLVAASIFGFKKVSKIKEIFEGMDILPDRISKFDASFTRLKFNLDIKLVNNSNEDLYVTGGSIVSLKQIIIFYRDTYLATVNVALNSIEIPKKGFYILRDIPVEVDLINVLQNATSLANFKMSELGITGIINAMGNDYEIGAE